jgi:hypothetical protein
MNIKRKRVIITSGDPTREFVILLSFFDGPNLLSCSGALAAGDEDCFRHFS